MWRYLLDRYYLVRLSLHKSNILFIVIFILLSGVISCLNVFYVNYPKTGSLLQNNGQLLGGDFLTFYNAGLIANTDITRLYDLDFQKFKFNEWIGSEVVYKNGELPFVYPPLIALLLKMYAKLPYKPSYLLWIANSALVSLLSLCSLIYNVRKFSFKHLLCSVVFLLGFFPLLLNTVIGGHMSWIGIALLSCTAILLKKNSYFGAGALFSLSFYKPPLFVFALLAFMLCYGRRFVYGFLLFAVLVIIASYMCVGYSAVCDFVALVGNYTYGREFVRGGLTLPVSQGAGLYALIFMFVNNAFLAQLVLSIVVVFLLRIVVSVKRIHCCSHELLAFIFVASVALSIQCIRYDLSILLVPFILIATSERGTLWNNYLVGISVVCFYFEWLFRGIEVGSCVFNLSSFLFIPLLLGLYAELKLQVRNGNARLNS